MAFETMSFNFDSKCYVIRGDNKDNEGQQSNGAAKTSFVDSIAILILGSSLTGRNVKDCVRWTSESTSFTIKGTLINEAHNLTCNIERTVYSNTKGQELVILVNGEVPTTLPTKKGVKNAVDVKLGNKYILESLLDLTESDLLSYFLISKSHYQPFLSINTDAKLDVISRFSKAEVVDKVISGLKIELEVSEDGVVEYNQQIATIEGYIKALEDSLNDAARLDFENNKQKQIESIETHIAQLEQNLLSKSDEIESQNNKVSQLQVVELDPQDKIELQGTHDSLNCTEAIKAQNELKQDKTKVSNYLAGLITCPKCSHEFSLESDKSYTQDDVTQLDILIAEFESEIQEATKLRKEVRESIELIESVEQQNKQTQREIDGIKRTIEIIENEQRRILKEIEQQELKLSNTKATTYADQQASVKDSISNKQDELQQVTLQLEELNKEIDNSNRWITNFEDFKFYLGNKPIEAICSLVNQYLSLNGSDLNLYIEGFKKLRSGELRQALMPQIYRNWSNPQPFVQFSEGEKVRLCMSVDLAFQQLINESSKFGGLDLYIGDENLNSLDSIGVGNAASAFNQLDKTIILVTHSGSDLVYPNTITIRKQNGKSVVI